MPRYTVRLQFAVAADFDVDLEAADEGAALDAANDLLEQAAPFTALGRDLAAATPRFVDGDVWFDRLLVAG